MTSAKNGDTVKVHYTGTLSDGVVFDSSEGRDPLTFELGAGQIIPGLETMVLGMNPGDEKTERIPCASAYGERRPELVIEVDRQQIPETIDLEPGMGLEMTQNNGDSMTVSVTAIDDDTVTLDANHPLAGKDLTFRIQLVAIV